MLPGNSSCQVIQCLEIGFLRKALTQHRFQYFHFQVGNHGGELLNCLTSPAIGTDDGDKLKIRSKSIRQDGSIGNIWMWTGENGGRPNNNCRRIHQRYG